MPYTMVYPRAIIAYMPPRLSPFIIVVINSIFKIPEKNKSFSKGDKVLLLGAPYLSSDLKPDV